MGFVLHNGVYSFLYIKICSRSLTKMEKSILECFLYAEKLRFSEIEKRVGVRSNKLSYYLGKLVEAGVLGKEDEFYFLSESSLKMIPYVSDKDAVMPVVLVAIEKEGKVFLVERKKRPFLGRLSLPGGRMVQGENFEEACVRIGRKFGVSVKFEKVCSVSLEHVGNGEERVHSFLLILVKAGSRDSLEYVDFTKKKELIVGSDYLLMERDLGKSLDIESFETLD